MALWVGKERALKPFLQLFITLDQKACLIPELRFPIPNLLNKKKVIFLPPIDFSSKISIFISWGKGAKTGRNRTDLLLKKPGNPLVSFSLLTRFRLSFGEAMAPLSMGST